MKKTNKDKIEFEKYLMQISLKYQKILLLDNSVLTWTFGTDNKNAYAESWVAYPYLSLNLHYSQEMLDEWLKNKTSKIVKRAIIHEMIHPLTDALYIKGIERYSSKSEINNERERLTDHIANIIIKNNL